MMKKVREYLTPKIQNKEFGWCVNQVISSLDCGNVSSSFSKKCIDKRNLKVLRFNITFHCSFSTNLKIHFKIIRAKKIFHTSF